MFYFWYGYEFLYEAYLYHFIRKDNRHNFSIYWLLIYQIYDFESVTWFSVLSFVPQWFLVVYVGFKLVHKDLFLTLFLQTFIFTTFNKVYTMQYGLWYQTLLPLLLQRNQVFFKKKGLIVLGLYVASILMQLS